jgi:hypothetical protein
VPAAPAPVLAAAATNLTNGQTNAYTPETIAAMQALIASGAIQVPAQ